MCSDGTFCLPSLQEVARFFKLVALCHTVLANVDEGQCCCFGYHMPHSTSS